MMFLRAFINILLLPLFIQSNPTPIQIANPFVQTGKYQLVISNQYQDLNLTNDIDPDIEKVFIKPFRNPFTSQPKISIGIHSYKVDASQYSSNLVAMLVYDFDITLNSFALGLISNKNYMAFLQYLSVNYLAADLNQNPQIISMGRHYYITPELQIANNTEPYWSHLFQYISYDKSPVVTSQVSAIITITSHHSLKRNMLGIAAVFSSFNSTSFRVRLSSYKDYFLSSISFHIIVVDTNLTMSNYRFFNLTTKIAQNSTRLADVFKTLNRGQNRLFYGFNNLSFESTTGSFAGFEINQTGNASIEQFDSFVFMRLAISRISIRMCESGYYYNQADHTCVSNCVYSKEIENRYCNSCALYCETCVSKNFCSVCVGNTRKPSQDYTQCVCIPGLFDDQVQTCSSCSILFGCVECNSSTYCTKCDSTLLLNQISNNGQCICKDNSQFDQNKVCYCIDGYYRNNDDCLKCDVTCFQCNDGSSSNCTQCSVQSYRQLKNNQCICKQLFQQQCSVSTSDCDASICYLPQRVQIIFDWDSSTLLKDSQSNTLIYVVNVNQDLQLFNEINYLDCVSFGYPVKSLRTTYQNLVLTFYAEYDSNIQGQLAQFKISLSTYSKAYIRINDFFKQYTLITKDHIALNVYPQSQYNSAKALSIAIYVLLGLALLTFLLGIHSSKVIIIQMINIMQITYFGLFLINFKDPAMAPLSLLRYTNGFSDILPKNQGNLPNRIYSLGFDRLVFNNLNIVFLVTIIPIIVSVMLLMVIFIKRRGKQRIISLFKLCVGQWTFFAILFLLYNICSSAVIFIKYVSLSKNVQFVLSTVQIGICFLISSLMGIFYGFMDYTYFGEFKSLFKWDKFSLNYYYIHIITRILFSTIIVIFIESFAPAIAITVILFGAFLLTSIKSPYADPWHSVRSSINFFIGFMIFLLFTLVCTQGTKGYNQFYSNTPIIIVSLLYVVVTMSLLFVIKQIRMNHLKGQVQLQQQPLNQSDMIQKQQNQILQMMKKKLQQNKKSGSNNLAHKLFVNKNKKLKKRKALFQTLNGQISDTVNNTNSNINHQPSFNTSYNQQGLTVEKVRIVDNMLKQGYL